MSPKKKPKIGIIGIGYVGGAVKNWFEKEKYPLFLYDKYKKIGSLEEIDNSEIIFICVPTPFIEKSGGYNDKAILESFKILKGSKIVVIKSTILPGSTEKLQRKFPQHKIVFNPEFLRSKTAKEDFLNPKRQIIGYTQKSKGIARRILTLLPKAPYQKLIPAKEAETAKYFGNAFLASKVIFANQMYDLCQKLGIDYEKVKEAAGADKMIGKTHLEIFHKGYRGYGGKCLRKDIKSLIKFADEQGIDLKLHKTVEEINNKLMGKQGIE